ncbi:MAG: threonine-phosphate decarboxylase [Rubellimicrobium sp.]|nr:threonine-phosphate decarboxylase [Rubellimicrobium sp.]
MRDHGGDLDAAMAQFGGPEADWIDLSTGINRRPRPLPAIPDHAWRRLPTRADQDGLVATAARAWCAAPDLAGIALAGAQAAIQCMPHLAPAGEARVLGPTYNEHAATLRAQGWSVTGVSRPEDLAGAGLAVLVNPNNPDGRRLAPGAVLALARRVGMLVVDESFGDVAPRLSVLPRLTAEAGAGRVVVLRSFGKFWGLAGLRLGFAFAAPPVIERIRALAGPWPVPGPAIAAGMAALADHPWAEAMRATLAADALRADALALAAGWRVLGGTSLFRLYATPDAAAARARLARHHIWSRLFPHDPHWLRLGLPGPEAEWQRLRAAMADDSRP